MSETDTEGENRHMAETGPNSAIIDDSRQSESDFHHSDAFGQISEPE